MSTTRVRSSPARNTRGRRGTNALTRAQLRKLTTELQREHARLGRSLLGKSGEGESPDGAEHEGGSGLQAPANAEGGFAVALESRLHARHAAIVDALARLDEGQYGRCASCKEGIPYGRLMVMPEALRCIACGSGGI